MLKYALVEVFEDKRKQWWFGGCLIIAEDVILLMKHEILFLRKNKWQDKLKYLHYIQF